MAAEGVGTISQVLHLRGGGNGGGRGGKGRVRGVGGFEEGGVGGGKTQTLVWRWGRGNCNIRRQITYLLRGSYEGCKVSETSDIVKTIHPIGTRPLGVGSIGRIGRFLMRRSVGGGCCDRCQLI